VARYFLLSFPVSGIIGTAKRKRKNATIRSKFENKNKTGSLDEKYPRR